MSTPTTTEDETLAQQLGRILADARNERGLSMNALARELEVAVPTLHQYEHGQNNPTLQKVAELAEQYGVELQLVVKKPKRTRKGK
jgi:transcriptional regulator with XRE-family HTH domain